MILTNPSLEVVRKGKIGYRNGMFRLTTPMRYIWSAKRCVIEIPDGTMTDFASIPRGFRNIVSINGAHRLPAILHDYLYSQAGIVQAVALIDMDGSIIELDKKHTIYYTRKDADDEFYVAMRLEGVNALTAYLMHKSVRVFGGIHIKLTGGKEWENAGS